MKVICFASSPAMPRTEATRLCTARRRSDGPRKHAAPEPVDGASSSCAVSRGGCAPRILATKCPRRTPSGRCRRGAPPTSSPRARFAAFSRAASTGLRISEALALQLQDVTDAGLVIRSSKFRKSRLVPLHDTTRRALQAYLAARERYAGKDAAVFLSEHRTALRYPTVVTVFLRLVRAIGIHPGPGKLGPRIHDLRHTFAVRSLEQCGGDRQAVARHMLALSTYLGHARLAHTYWYLQATPQLLADVAAQSESLATRGAR